MNDQSLNARAHQLARGVGRLVHSPEVLQTFRDEIEEFKEERAEHRAYLKRMEPREREHADKILAERERLKSGDGEPHLTGHNPPGEGWEFGGVTREIDDEWVTVRGWFPPELVEYQEAKRRSSSGSEEARTTRAAKYAWLAALHDFRFPENEPIIDPPLNQGDPNSAPELYITLPMLCSEEGINRRTLEQLEKFLDDVEGEVAQAAESKTKDKTLETPKASGPGTVQVTRHEWSMPKCPSCGSRQTPVEDTKPPKANRRIRYHRCANCEERFKTVETLRG